MAHEVYWLKQDRVLYASYQGFQTEETARACLDDMAAEFDKVDYPAIVLVNWLEVTGSDKGLLRKVSGHRAYSHPMAARGVLVGFDPLTSLDNEITAVNTRGDKNTMYFKTMEEAKDYLKDMLMDDNLPSHT